MYNKHRNLHFKNEIKTFTDYKYKQGQEIVMKDEYLLFIARGIVFLPFNNSTRLILFDAHSGATVQVLNNKRSKLLNPFRCGSNESIACQVST